MWFSFSILAALVFLLKLVGAHAVPDLATTLTSATAADDKQFVDIGNNPAPAGEDTYYCGYIYGARGLRGGSAALAADNGRNTIAGGPGRSAIVSAGCECAFFKSKNCYDNYPKITKAWQGDFDFGVNCFTCVQGARKANVGAPAEAQPENTVTLQ